MSTAWRPRPKATKAACGDLVRPQHELYIKVEPLPNEESRKLDEDPELASRRQELRELLEPQRAEAESEPRLLVPEAPAEHGGPPQNIVGAAVVAAGATGLAKAGAIVFRQREPLANELANLHWHGKVVGEHPLERERRSRVLSQEAGIEQEGLVLDFQTATKSGRRHPKVSVERLRERILDGSQPGCLLVRDRDAVLLPRPIEKRDRPMVEDIEELGDRTITLPLALEHQLRVVPRQDTRRSREPHESH